MKPSAKLLGRLADILPTWASASHDPSQPGRVVVGDALYARYKAVSTGGVAFLVGLVLTGAGVLWQRAQLDAQAAVQFGQEVDRIEREVKRRLILPQYGLKGLRGAYAASDDIRRSEFRAYVESRDLPNEFPGIRGMGFIERIPRSQLNSFVARVRADEAPSFNVLTRGSAEDLFVIKYIEPIATNVAAWGFDVGQEPVRREAAERAMDTGQPALTGKITLLQDTEKTPGFLLYVPVYRTGTDPATPAQRRTALVGLVYAPIVASELFQGMTGHGGADVDVEIHQGSEAAEDQLIFRAELAGVPSDQRSSPRYEDVRRFEVAGTAMRVQVRSTPQFERRQDRSNLLIAGLLGLVVSFFMALALWLLALGRVRAQQLAQSMTADLDRMARVVQYTDNAVMVSDAQSRITWVNAGFTRLTGFTESEAIGKTPGELLASGKADPQVLQTLAMSVAAGIACRVEILNRAKNGREYWVDTEVQPLHDAEGELVGFMEIGTDITARVMDRQKIAELSDRMALAIEGGSDGLWDWYDISQDAQWWSPSYHSMLGYTADQLPPSVTSHRAIMHPDFVEDSRSKLQVALAGGAAYDMELQLRTKSAGYRWFRLRAKAFFNHDGKAYRMAGSTQDIHERKMAQAAVVKTNERFALAADSAGIGVWEWDLENRNLTWDAQMYRLYRHGSHSTRPPLDILMGSLHPDDLPRFEHNLQQTIRHDKAFEDSYRIFWPNGEVRYIQAAARVVRNATGRAVRLTGVNFDITAVKHAQDAIAESEAFLDRAGHIAGVGGWRVDVRAGTLHWTRETRRIHDVGDDYVPDTARAIQFYALDAQPVIRQAMERGIATGEGWDLELPMVTATGRAIWVRIVGEVEMEGGEAVMLVGALQDISERRKLTQAISTSNQLMTDVLQNLPCGLSVFDGNLVLVAQNPQLRSLLGLPDSLFEGPEVSFESIIRYNAQMGEYGDSDVESTVAAIVERARNPVAHIFERQRPNGVPLEIRGVPLPGGGFITTYMDISESKKVQHQLSEALEAAQQASISKSQFLANMSHEIRTPMNAILGLLKLLQNTALDLRQQDYVGKTEGAARSLLGLLNDILDFSKVEAGKMTLDPRPFRIDRLLRDLSVILSANVGPKDVEVLFDVDPALPQELVGDDMRLQQVLINLGGNAIKFTSQGEVVLRLRQVARTDDSVMVEFAVQDSGIGIAPENQAWIFSGFSQAEASTTRRFGGTGLGLAISSRLTSLMGGELKLKSSLGEGSTFTFVVCFALTEPGLEPVSGTEKLSDSDSLRTLVVDDNPIARQLMVDMAQSLGWQVDAVASGEEAVTLVQQAQDLGQAYQTIFMDWRMPGMDGWQTSQRIRDIATEAPVVMMVTAYGREMLAQRSVEDQSLLSGFLVKPVTASMLLEALQSARRAGFVGKQPLQEPSAEMKQQRLLGLRILVVEDNAINQMVAQGLLRAEGALVSLAADGQQGVEAAVAAQPPFDVVLMDVQMPIMDGYTAARVLRGTMGLSRLPIIAMTANAMASDRAACLEAGMNDHVGKPFELDHLVAVILQHCGGLMVHGDLAAVSHSNAVALPAQQDLRPGELDLDAAALRLGGDTKILADILKSFADDLPQVAQRIQSQWVQGQVQDAMRALHTLKGLASTVGARHLAQVAAGLEGDCKNGLDTNAFAARLTQLQASVDATLQNLADVEPRFAFPTPANPMQAVVMDALTRQALRDGLTNLKILLEAADMGALQAHQDLYDLHSAVWGEPWHALDRAMADLEFEAAARCCDALLDGVLA